ncbi:transporter [Halomarina halobia]|uniref:Transporter n=1 Tax=Halomarina halobia TaxID=3033386 RepID=A0ABD6A9M0_9EURY|nr:transporter [Halomarina sp. PSR21]
MSDTVDERDRATASRGEPASLPVVTGALAGVLAWLLGYAATYAASVGRVEAALAEFNVGVSSLGGDPLPAWKAVGWLYYGGHFVDVRLLGLPGGSRSFDLVAGSDSAAAPLLYLLPPLVLVLASALVLAANGVRDVRTALLTSVPVTLGYGALAALFAAQTRHAFGGGVVGGVDPLAAVAVAGVAYPLAFGALGGLVGVQLSSRP